VRYALAEIRMGNAPKASVSRRTFLGALAATAVAAKVPRRKY
jgi:hypothetical protein